MPSPAKPLRLSVVLSPPLARRLRALAPAKKAGVSHVIAELVQSGLAARDTERNRFFQLADHMTRSSN